MAVTTITKQAAEVHKQGKHGYSPHTSIVHSESRRYLSKHSCASNTRHRDNNYLHDACTGFVQCHVNTASTAVFLIVDPMSDHACAVEVGTYMDASVPAHLASHPAQLSSS